MGDYDREISNPMGELLKGQTCEFCFSLDRLINSKLLPGLCLGTVWSQDLSLLPTLSFSSLGIERR